MEDILDFSFKKSSSLPYATTASSTSPDVQKSPSASQPASQRQSPTSTSYPGQQNLLDQHRILLEVLRLSGLNRGFNTVSNGQTSTPIWFEEEPKISESIGVDVQSSSSLTFKSSTGAKSSSSAILNPLWPTLSARITDLPSLFTQSSLPSLVSPLVTSPLATSAPSIPSSLPLTPPSIADVIGTTSTLTSQKTLQSSASSNLATKLMLSNGWASPGSLKRRRRSALSSRDGNDTDSPTMIKQPKFVPDDKKDEAYWERRRKNNDAAKRSRDSRRAKEEEVALRATFLKQENWKLRAQVNVLKTEIGKLHFLLFNNVQQQQQLSTN